MKEHILGLIILGLLYWLVISPIKSCIGRNSFDSKINSAIEKLEENDLAAAYVSLKKAKSAFDPGDDDDEIFVGKYYDTVINFALKCHEVDSIQKSSAKKNSTNMTPREMTQYYVCRNDSILLTSLIMKRDLEDFQKFQPIRADSTDTYHNGLLGLGYYTQRFIDKARSVSRNRMWRVRAKLSSPSVRLKKIKIRL